MFASDRDLLALEPGLYAEVSWASQRLVQGVGTISGTTLTMASQDNGFDESGVGAGHVVVFDDHAYEVVSLTSASVLEVSRLRADVTGAALPGTDVASKPVRVTTFDPQLALAHRQLLAMLGIEPDGAVGAGVVTESQVMNPEDLIRVEALGAIYLVLTGASAVAGPFSVMGRRAELYRRRFEAERRAVAVVIDTDGDGQADATRRLNALRLERA